MANICFVSLDLISHCDFGGMSYLSTATELKRRGHNVTWIVVDAFGGDRAKRTRSTIVRSGVPLVSLSDSEPLHLHASYSGSRERIASSVLRLVAYLESNHIDAVAVDRLCIFANCAAHKASCPWANMGTDGLQWTFKPNSLFRRLVPGRLGHGVTHNKNLDSIIALLGISDFPEISRNSYWGASPFLNISFFPRSFYGDVQDKIAEHSHFVGASHRGRPNGTGQGGSLLVALGNTFQPVIRQKFLRALTGVIREYEVSSLILTGSEDLTDKVSEQFRGNSYVDTRTWVPYEEAFSRAQWCIGHGGAIFLWYSIQYEVPPLVIPSGYGDQHYNASQMERYGVSVVVPHRNPLLLTKRFKHLGVTVNEQALAGALSTLLAGRDNPAFHRLSSAMSAGGGVRASATLIELLADQKAPVEKCPSDPCCC